MKAEQFKKVIEELQGVLSEFSKVKEELTCEELTISAAAGMVKIIAKGDRKIKTIQISDDLWNTNDKKMIEDTIVASINYALNKVDEFLESKANDKMQSSFGDILKFGPKDIPF
jgi:hypothetical protein